MRIDKDTLFMRYPSAWWHDLWREGLPSGNGTIGACVYGGVKEETTMILHHDLWHGGREDELPDVSDVFRRQREMMDREEFPTASWEVVNELKRKNYNTRLESPLPAADLLMQIQPDKGFEHYIRGIHMDTGEVGCEWLDGGSARSSYLFVSRTRDMIVKRITSANDDLNIIFSLDMHINEGSHKEEKYAGHVMESKKISMTQPFLIYTAQNDDGTSYGVVARILPGNGELETTPAGIRVKKSNEILVLIKVFVKENPEHEQETVDRLKKELSSVAADYGTLLNEHEKEHGKWYNSAQLSLGYEGEYHCNEDLLASAYSGKQPVELIEKLWKYGRYLFISGTSEQSNPFPLYGLWAGDYRLTWSHNMANENMQMIYWHTYVGNLLPFQKGMYQYFSDRIPAYQNNVRKQFGMRGIYIPAGTTPGVSAPNQIVPVIMNWVGAAGWLAQHYYRYYQYTRDEQYLKDKLLPFLEEVASFYEDFVEFYPDGRIHFYPSVSPENTPQNFMPPEHIQMAHPMPTTVNSTIDLAIVREVLTSLCEIAKEQKLYDDRVDLWKKIIAAIPEYKISADGGIREWQDERFEERYAHRHLSHIYPVFPGYEVNKLHKAHLLPAFRRAVDLREIDAQTGWSMAHMSAIYARFEDGEAAMQCLNNMAKSVLTNNFFTLHNDWRKMNISLCMDPPVQLDAVMGYVNALQEMILYVSEDLVKLLPALSASIQKGSVRDFRYVNGCIDMTWDMEKRSFTAALRAVRRHKMYIQLPAGIDEYKFTCENCSIFQEGELYKLEMERNGKLWIM
ncbi:MAG: glycoside hydrolase N-terminal domain-containing protein [Lachnospiraceae bacterium]|nr:glycoside hydrolase N-terminal domain-containing protein [Lachnospiraceae bacterium]